MQGRSSQLPAQPRVGARVLPREVGGRQGLVGGLGKGAPVGKGKEEPRASWPETYGQESRCTLKGGLSSQSCSRRPSGLHLGC